MEKEVHDLHHQYISTLIQKEEQRIAFRQSVIEKTTAALIWSLLVGVATAVWAYLKDHLK